MHYGGRAKLPVSRAYTPYGYNRTATTESLLGFNAQLRDSFTGFYMLGNGYRALSCALQRFLSPDILSPFDRGGINTYAYCASDPVNRVDPSGRMSWLKALFQKSITFEDDYQVLFPGRKGVSSTTFHKEVFKTGNAGFVTHGHADGSPRLMNEHGNMVSARKVAMKEIAPRLKGLKSYRADPNKPIYLIACKSGASGAAQEVANALNRPVIGYRHNVLTPDDWFMNTQAENHPWLGLFELPPVPYVRRTATPITFNPVGRIRRKE
ncbi:RHS repeat-associated core domain-containing protein [Pseudomonas sp. SAR267]|uniref:RHS repeat-associated core domain-containing protein n=1 Tax=unclassified Pseudomonas TaxID=196821 RepID=UPI0028A7BB31|nr:RHS repeat-associated core domain-containing protein [Pseudomonas sp.]